jgi:nitrogen fixation protein NifX
MLKIAFASDNRTQVNQHFGSATAFVLYDVTPVGATFCGVGEFPEQEMDGNETKLLDKVSFLADCDAVFIRAIGASVIKQLLAQGVHPVRVEASDSIENLLLDVRIAMREGDVPWVERALATKAKAKAPEHCAATPDRFSVMEAEGWEG